MISESGQIFQGPRVPEGLFLACAVRDVLLDETMMDGLHDGSFAEISPPGVSDELALSLARGMDVGVFGVEGNAVLCGALAAITPKRRPFSVGVRSKLDINYFHHCAGHLCEFLLRESAKQQGLKLGGTMETCVPCVTIKGRRASVPKTGGRASEPGVTYHLDLCGGITPSLCGCMYLLVVVDRFSRFMLMYGLRRKSDATAGFKVAITDLAKYGRGNLDCVRVDMGTEWTCREFREFCANGGIRIEYTAPDTPQQNAPVESAIWRLMKGGTVCRRSVATLFGIADFSVIPGLDARGDMLWLESVRYICECFNRCGTKANRGNISPFEAFTGTKPDTIVLPFFQPGQMRVIRCTKLDDQTTPCFFLNHGNNHGRSTVRLLKQKTGRPCFTKDIVWVSAGHGGGVVIPATLPMSGPLEVPVPPRFSPSPQPGLPLPGTGGAPATQPRLPPPSSSPPAPSPLPTPPQPLVPLSGAGETVAPPPLTPLPPSTPQPLAPLPGSEVPYVGLLPAGKGLPRPAVMPPLSRRAVTELRSGRTGGMDDVRMASRTRSGRKKEGADAAEHNRGLLSRMGRESTLSRLAALDMVAELRHGNIGGAVGPEEGERFSMGLVMRLARLEDIEGALRDQRPPHDRPELPLCHGSDLRVPKTYAEATSPHYQYSNLFVDAMQREVYGIIEAVGVRLEV